MLQPLTPLLAEFRARFPSLDGPVHTRKDACGFCGSKESALLSKADYWDLAEVDLVRCKSCGLSQLDPMFSPEVTEKGCVALYRFQQAGETERSRRRGLYRSFRRGVAFGVSLKLKGVNPKTVLEVGAGDAYFIKGLQYVFPYIQVTVLDLVEEILSAMKSQHGFNTICCALEDLDSEKAGRFDLVVARDILEHVSAPRTVLKKLVDVIEPHGHLFFITPNGWQDAWQMYSRWQSDQTRSELLINHVNYFDAPALRTQLEKFGLQIQDWYIYDLKTFWRGAGWRMIEKHKSRPSTKRSADAVLNQTGRLTSTFERANIKPVPVSYGWKIARPFWMTYCWLKHSAFIRVRPEARVGEEIYCFAEKK